MPILEKLIEWSKTLPAWQSDAMRRIFKGALSDNDENEILEFLKSAHGLKSELSVKPILFAPESKKPVLPEDSSFSLDKIHSLKNVNRIKDGEFINFHPAGITVIYGDNASGKSGYGRVFKRACRARHSGDRILSNLFDSKFSFDLTAEASFDIKAGGQTRTINWKEDDLQNSDLSRIAIFDKECARVHVSEDNEIDFLPYAADVLINLAKLCDKLKIKIQNVMLSLPTLPFQLDDYSAEGEAYKFVRSLNANTKKEYLEKLTELTDKEKKQYKNLRQVISERDANDPKKLSVKHSRRSQRWASFKQHLISLRAKLSDVEFTRIKKLFDDAVIANKAVELLSKQDFSDEHLPGVGSGEWRLMFEAARKYAEEFAYPDTNFEDTFNIRCVLCQQELTPNASDRMKRFNDFIQSDVESKAKKLRSNLAKDKKALEETTLEPLKGQDDFKEDFEANHQELSKQIYSFLDAAKTRHDILEKGLSTGVWIEINEIPDITDSLKKLEQIKTKEDEIATAYEKQELTDEQKKEAKDYQSLKERLLLHKHKSAILVFINGLEVKKRLEACKKALNTTHISRKQNELLKEAVTDELFKSLKNELNSLGVQTIKPKLKRVTQKGVVSHRITLEGMSVPEMDLSGVLSEGEGLVVAIASFLAELKLAPKFSVVIFDDPVCSLDHHWRERVAKRLIELSKERQVIIFTHDILFLYELDFQAKRLNISDKFMLHAMESRGDHAGIILPDDELPFDTLPVKKRVGRLRKKCQEARGIFNETDSQTEKYRETVKSVYSSLRSAWERAVEELLFGNVVVRFRKSINTLELKNVATDITREDCQLIYDEMTRCSNVTDAHDSPGASRSAVSTPDELSDDIERLEDFRKTIDQRRRETATNVPVGG